MSEEYQVPKREIEARVLLAGGASEDLRLYLSERAERHSGPERPSDLFGRDEPFVPARFTDGGFALLRRRSVLVVTVAADDEYATGAGVLAEEGAERERVRLVLEEGTRVEGTIVYVMPPGERRLQDFLNQAGDFVRVRDGDIVKLVNTARIVRVEPL